MQECNDRLVRPRILELAVESAKTSQQRQTYLLAEPTPRPWRYHLSVQRKHSKEAINQSTSQPVNQSINPPYSTGSATNQNKMSRPSLDGIKQASVGAMDKARLMVGLKNNNRDEQEEESQQSERSSFVEEAADLLCPELTFQQRLIGFASCFALGCKWNFGSDVFL